MRCVFAYEICLVHLSAMVWYAPQGAKLAETLLVSLARTGTVGFLMLAGATLIHRPPGRATDYLAARFRRWLPMLVAAQLIYLAFSLLTGAKTPAILSPLDAITPAWIHIWFFYALGAVYIVVIPMRHYAAWTTNLSPRNRMAALWLPVLLLFGGSGWVTALGGFWGDLRPLNMLVYCGYAWTGYVLTASFPNGLRWAGALMLFGVCGAALTTVAASDAAPVSTYFHRCSFFVAIAATGQFLLLLRANAAAWTTAMVGRVHRLARLTLGIFIVHPMLIVLAGWPGSWTPHWALLGRLGWLTLPLVAAALFAVSALITWLVLHAHATLRRRPFALAACQPIIP